MPDPTSPGSSPVSILVGDSVVRATEDATIRQAADALVTGGVGALVFGEGDRPVALLSERDVVRAIAEGRDPATAAALDIATTDLIWCDSSATVDEVAEEMMENYIRHVLVEEDGVLIGIVSARDLLGIYSSEATLD